MEVKTMYIPGATPTPMPVKETERKYTADELLEVLGAYRRQIIRNGNDYPMVCLDDLFASINHVLRVNNYQGFYRKDNEYFGKSICRLDS